jgi:hypothetical protein
MSAKRKTTLILVGVFLAAILFALMLHRPTVPVGLSVGFLGYTNVTGERFARFVITNESRLTIRRWGHFDREVRKSRWLAYTRNIGSHVLLSPGQSEVVLVPLDAEPAATFQKDWRAVFYWRQEDLKTRFYIWADSSPIRLWQDQWLPIWVPHMDGIPVNPAASQWMDQ